MAIADLKMMNTVFLTPKRCSDDVHIRTKNNCDLQPTYTCSDCIFREREGSLCWLKKSNEYCCLVNPADYGWTCPEEYRYYVCPPLSVSISGPSQLPSGQAGTFTANVGGGTPAFSYQWYKLIMCPTGPDAPCNQWYLLSNDGPSIQTGDEWDFI